MLGLPNLASSQLIFSVFFSKFKTRFFLCRIHITSAYPNFSHYSYNFSQHMKWKAIRIFISILHVTKYFIYISGDKLSCITNPKFIFSIDILFCSNLYVYVSLIPLFPISNIQHFIALNSIFHIFLHSYILFTLLCNSSQSLWFLIFHSNFASSVYFLSCHSHILKTLLVTKLIPIIFHFLLPSILIFHPLLLFSFPFLSSSLLSKFLMFLSILQCISTSIVISCAEAYRMPLLSLNLCNPPIYILLVLYLSLLS